MKPISVGAILIFSPEPEKSVDFYRRAFGFSLVEERHAGAAPHWGCMVGNTHLAIHHTRLNRGQPGVAFSLTTDDLDRALGELAERGFRPLHAPIAMDDGARRCTLKDPDGNTVSLVQLARGWRVD